MNLDISEKKVKETTSPIVQLKYCYTALYGNTLNAAIYIFINVIKVLSY